MYNDYDDYDPEEEIRSQRITHLYLLRHACNVLGPDYVESQLNISEDRVVILYNSIVHGSEALKPFLKCTDDEFKGLIKEGEERAHEHQDRMSKVHQKHEDLIGNLKTQRKDFAGIGTNKSKRRLNKLALVLPLAKAVRLALEIEDKNISAKNSYGTYQEKIYKQKERLILELCQIFQEQVWMYGVQESEIPLATSVIYFEIPDCEQISWHFSPDEISNFPKYMKAWDEKENSTLKKLELVTIQLLTENDFIKH